MKNEYLIYEDKHGATITEYRSSWFVPARPFIVRNLRSIKGGNWEFATFKEALAFIIEQDHSKDWLLDVDCRS